MSQINHSTSSPSIKEFASLITICFSVIVFQQLTTITNRQNHSYIVHLRPWQTAFLVGLLGLLIYTLRTEFAKQNATLVFILISFVCTISILSTGYYLSFPQYYSWLIMLMTSMVALFVRRSYHLTIFMSAVTAATIILLLITESPGIDKEIFSVVLVIYNSILYIGVKEKLSVQSAYEKSEQCINSMAYYDSITNLPNRNLLYRDLRQQIMARNPNLAFALLFVGLEDFKNVSDVFGHSISTQVLKEASSRLLSCIGKRGSVYRYYGEEFIIVLDNTNPDECSDLAKQILNSMDKPFSILLSDIYTSASIGIGFYPDHGHDAETLIKNSSSAMCFARKKAKNSYQFFNDELRKTLTKKLETENGLRKAIYNNELSLFYQPLMDLDTDELIGFEALLRWYNPSLGMVSPVDFIPLAEETGLIVPIGEWVMEKAFRQCKEWKDSGTDMMISINVSGYQIEHSDILKSVSTKLSEAALPPENVIIEITESVMQDYELTSRVVDSLKSIGVRVALDDFGTGYSSLGLLKSLSIDILKIDSSFIKDIEDNTDNLEILKLIINIGYTLDFEIIIEGIETQTQADLLRNINCRFGQGYLFSLPLPADKVRAYLQLV